MIARSQRSGDVLEMVIDLTLQPPVFMTMTCLGLNWLSRLARKTWRIWIQLALFKLVVVGYSIEI